MEIISPLQEEILKTFGEAPDSQNFYLTGGTALAHFYLRHRRSNDLDFFTPVVGLVEPFSRGLEKTLEARGMKSTRRRGVRSFIDLQVSRARESTIVQLAQDSPFRFEPPKSVAGYPGLRIDSLRDIASNKLLALFGRAALRDFIDVYFLVEKGHFKREALIKDARQKDPGYDPYWLGVAFERIKTFQQSDPEMLMLLEPLPLQNLVSWFDDWRKKVAKELKA